MYTGNFSARLKKAREYNGFTQNEVSKSLKIGRSTYAGYESGLREPDIETIAMLSRLYCISADWLLGLTPDSGINAINQVLEEREREKMLKKLEREAEMTRRIWG